MVNPLESPLSELPNLRPRKIDPESPLNSFICPPREHPTASSTETLRLLMKAPRLRCCSDLTTAKSRYFTPLRLNKKSQIIYLANTKREITKEVHLSIRSGHKENTVRARSRLPFSLRRCFARAHVTKCLAGQKPETFRTSKWFHLSKTKVDPSKGVQSFHKEQREIFKVFGAQRAKGSSTNLTQFKRLLVSQS